MIRGLLWLDDDAKRTLEEKVARAVKRHDEKFGRNANVCYVHPSVLEVGSNGSRESMVVGDVEVKPRSSVLKHHFFVGCEIIVEEDDETKE